MTSTIPVDKTIYGKGTSWFFSHLYSYFLCFFSMFTFKICIFPLLFDVEARANGFMHSVTLKEKKNTSYLRHVSSWKSTFPTWTLPACLTGVLSVLIYTKALQPQFGWSHLGLNNNKSCRSKYSLTLILFQLQSKFTPTSSEELG